MKKKMRREYKKGIEDKIRGAEMEGWERKMGSRYSRYSGVIKLNT